jgi:hypothetical protein
MSGYLDQYGAGEEKRENFIRNTILMALLAIVVLALGYYLFRTFPETRSTKAFLNRLRARDYTGAYTAWGCATPCQGYDYNKFLEDWGPKSEGANNPVLRVTDSENCGNGVMVSVKVSPGREENLFVEKGTAGLSFSPVPVCPGKGPWSIMIHRTIGKLRWVFY